jgi:glycosyltransferase involved in cell wall biosynthesis
MAALESTKAGNVERGLLSFEPIPLPSLPDNVLFSVLIPNYNYARYVNLAIESVLKQTYRNYEVIVCDDGSTDNSREVIQKYVNKDARVRLTAQMNRGFGSAVNTAFENSKGQVIALLDADDTFTPQKLEKVLEAFRKNSRSGECVHPILPVSVEGKPLGPASRPDMDRGWIGPRALKRGGWSILPPTSGLSFRREVASMLFPIPLVIRRFVDYYLSRTAQFLTEISFVPEALTEYRMHGSSMSGMPVGAGSAGLQASRDPGVIRKYIEDFEEVLPIQKDFLRRFYGPGIADALKLEDHPRYWDDLLAMRALCGRRAGAIRAFPLREMLNHIPVRLDRRVWRAIVLLPDPLAGRAYCFWRTPSRLKTVVKAVIRLWLAR